MEDNEMKEHVCNPPVSPLPVPSITTAALTPNEQAIMSPLPMDVESDGSHDSDDSDSNWSTGSSFNEDSDEESILTFDTVDDESMNFVRPKAGRSEWSISCCSSDEGPFSRPDGEGSWRMDQEESYSDYTLVVVSKETGEERVYHVHKFTLAHGQSGCEYFAALFRTPCRENDEGSSRFTFPEEVAICFPDFLDIMYNPRYMENIFLYFRKFEENLYGGNLLSLRSLALYFGCRRLLSNICWKIKDAINDMHRCSSGGLWAVSKLVPVLCEDDTAEDAQELLGHIVQALVRCFDQFASDQNKEVLSSIIGAMSPDVLLSLLSQATCTLTNRYRIYKCGSSKPFTAMVIEYLHANDVTTWQFERFVLYLLDFLQPNADAGLELVKQLIALAEKRLAENPDMLTRFVSRALMGHAKGFSESIIKVPICMAQQKFHNSTDTKTLKVIVEGKFEGNQSSAAVEYGGEALGGNQGNPDVFSIETVSTLSLNEVKALVYLKTGLGPSLQQIQLKDEEGDLVLFKENDTFESIGAFSREVSLYLHAIPYCPPEL